MVLLPEAASECSKGAPGETPVRSPQQCCTTTRLQSQSDNSVLLLPGETENGNINNCPVQIKVYRDDVDDRVVKQPSYVSLARCISGYTLLTTYDSKQREGFRSRDISPARVPLPIPVGPSLANHGRNTNSCLAVNGGNINNGNSYSSNINNNNSDHINCNQQQAIIKSPLTASPLLNDSAPNITTLVTSSSSSNTDNANSAANSMESKSCTVQSETTSFVLQRVERLYGPGALAQGFYARHNARRSLLAHDDHSKSNGTSPVVNGSGSCSSYTNGIESSSEESLPVLKLLRPEFRAQLSVARHKLRSPSVDDVDGTSSPRRERIIPITLESSKEITKTVLQKNGQHSLTTNQGNDGHYYLKVVHDEMAALLRLADDLHLELSSGKTPEELDGRLRSAIGKARLLVAEKLRQFEGLCHKNMSQDLTDNFRTTNEDLAGFWDMVLIQVDSVHKEFDDIAKLRDNGWKQVILKTSPVTPKTNTISKPPRRENATTNENNKTIVAGDKQKSGKGKDARDEARRKLLQERRLAMKKSMSATANQDQVFIS